MVTNMIRFLIILLLIIPAVRTYAFTWQDGVYHYAKLYKINPCVVFAIIDTESSGNSNAITVNYDHRHRSYRTRRQALKVIGYRYRDMDIGLMQINYYWIRKKLKVTKSMLLKPLYNIDIGEWLLKELLIKYNYDYTKAVTAYHSSDYKRGTYYAEKVKRAYKRNRWDCLSAQTGRIIKTRR